MLPDLTIFAACNESVLHHLRIFAACNETVGQAILPAAGFLAGSVLVAAPPTTTLENLRNIQRSVGRTPWSAADAPVGLSGIA